jgi:hypothetical protein
MAARLAGAFHEQAIECARHGSALYASLCEHLAVDLERGGPTEGLLAGFAASPPPLLPLRLLGGIHAAVLSREAPELALHFPSVGGEAGPDGAWPALRQLIAERPEVLTPWLARTPQTNEVGRCAVLAGGLAYATALSGVADVDLREVGSSAGLNLRVDAYRIAGRGPVDSPVDLGGAWRGAVPPEAHWRIADRRGCDADPVDPVSPDGRLALTAYVWPDDRPRFERLRAALELAARIPAVVERADAVDWVRGLAPTSERLTVVWHSVVALYLPRARRVDLAESVAALGALAAPGSPVAWLRMEPEGRGETFPVRLTLWTGGGRMGREMVLGAARPHGIPVDWTAAGEEPT